MLDVKKWVAKVTETLKKILYNIDFLTNNQGIAFGVQATEIDTFECDLKAKMNKGIYLENDLRTFSIKPTNDGTNMDIGWDWTNADGAGLALQNNDSDGGFLLFTHPNASTSYQLSGSSTGLLLWNGSFQANSINGYVFDVNTNNTSDTWVLVMNGNNIQHRVIPSNASTYATKYGSVWTNGNIALYRRGNVVQCTGSPTLTAVSTRTQIATIPTGYRPVATAYAHSNDMAHYFIFTTGGLIQTGGAETAGTKYFSTTWVVDS